MKNVRDTLDRSLTGFFNWVVVITLSLIVAIIFLEIFFRYILNDPLFWSEELAKFIFPWMIFPGAALASRACNHIKVDFFAGRLPKAFQPVIDRIVQALSFIFCVLIIIYTVPLAQSQIGVSSTALSIPLNWYSLSVVIGGIGMIFFLFWGKGGEKRI
jgi:TRAP-type C4-dicarboxylate transport system permease small subunit